MHSSSEHSAALPGRRVLFVCNAAWFFVSHRLALVREALDRGFEVHVAADVAERGEEAAIVREGGQFHLIPVSRAGLNPVSDARTFAAILSLVRRIRPSVVHTVTVKPVVYGGLAARLARVPRVVSAISGLGYAFASDQDRSVVRGLVRMAYRLALNSRRMVVLFQNEDDRSLFVDAGIVDQATSALIPGSGVDLDQFHHVPQSSGTAPLIVLPARMLRDKGVVEFCLAVKELRESGRQFEAVLAGGIDGHNRASLRADELARLATSSGVAWLGQVADMHSLYARSHVVCLPSYREGMPKALLEACAVGRPIVTTDVPGCRDVVTHGVNGLLVPPRAVTELRDALARLLDDEHLRSLMGKAGRHRALNQFDVRAISRATLDLYESGVVP